MIRIINKFRIVLTVTLLVVPMLAFGQYQTDSLRWFNGETIYYLTLPNRLFVHKDSTVSQEYLINLLNRVIDSEYEIIWCPRTYPEHLTDRYHEDACDVVVEDALIDDVISELIKDDGILTARRVYIERSDYERGVESDLIHPGQEKSDPLYGHYSYTYAQWNEWWFFYDEIHCEPYDKLDVGNIPTDSICKALGLTFEYQEQSMFPYVFMASKGADILKTSADICKTGYFKFAMPQCWQPFASYGTTAIKNTSSESKKKDYYNLSGQKTDTPSGLTIVVEQSSDGTVSTEKKLF